MTTLSPAVLSVNVGGPRSVQWHGRTVLTSIWKTPVTGAVRVGVLNLDGDEQSDLTVHGGPHKAVYVYPSEHYEHWRSVWPDITLDWAAFGENLTIAGLLEGDVRIGDRLRIGSAEFAVAQPRFPCFKLGIRLNRDDVIKPFLVSGRSGFYLSVIKEGELSIGDAIDLVPQTDHDVTISDVAEAYATAGEDQNLLRRIIEVRLLPPRLREHFVKLSDRD